MTRFLADAQGIFWGPFELIEGDKVGVGSGMGGSEEEETLQT